MNISCAIRSDRCLASALKLYEALQGESHLSLNLLVFAPDNSALAQSVRHRLGGLDEAAIHLHFIQEVEGVTYEQGCRDAMRSHRSNLLCLFYREEDQAFEQSLFEKVAVATLWIKDDEKDVISLTKVIPVTSAPNQLVGSFYTELGSALLDPLGFDHSSTFEAVQESLAELAEAEARSNASPTIFIDLGDLDPRRSDYDIARRLLQAEEYLSVAVFRSGVSPSKRIGSRIKRAATHFAPAMQRSERIELARELQGGSELNLEFIGLMAASAMLASFGLLQNSASVIIGAMLIAPLMTPILGAGLALTQGNRPLFRASLITIFLGFVSALFASMAFGVLFMVFREPWNTEEMWARCKPSPLDFCVGLVGGIAASYARTRSHLSSALAGAAIAAALVPPIATAGLQIVFMDWAASPIGTPVIGPLLLVSVNVLTIMFGASFVLWIRGMKPDSVASTTHPWVLRSFAFLILFILMILIWILQPK